MITQFVENFEEEKYFLVLLLQFYGSISPFKSSLQFLLVKSSLSNVLKHNEYYTSKNNGYNAKPGHTCLLQECKIRPFQLHPISNQWYSWLWSELWSNVISVSSKSIYGCASRYNCTRMFLVFFSFKATEASVWAIWKYLSLIFSASLQL